MSYFYDASWISRKQRPMKKKTKRKIMKHSVNRYFGNTRRMWKSQTCPLSYSFEHARSFFPLLSANIPISTLTFSLRLSLFNYRYRCVYAFLFEQRFVYVHSLSLRVIPHTCTLLLSVETFFVKISLFLNFIISTLKWYLVSGYLYNNI